MTDCHDIRIQADDYVRGLLSREEAGRVEAHLDACPGCAAGVAALRLLPARAADPGLPEAYTGTILPRIRQRIEARSTFRLPELALRYAAPALGCLLLAMVAGNLLPKSPGADAGGLLASLGEDDLAEVAATHESGALITSPAGEEETSAPDVDDTETLASLLEGEDTTAVSSYVDTDAALGDLADDEQTQLLALLDTH
jgi:anti-sigma factor RsiW